MERVPRTCVGMWHPCGAAWAFGGWNVWVFWLACCFMAIQARSLTIESDGAPSPP